VNVKTVIKLLQKSGWKQVRMKGSHRQFKHPEIPGLVTVPGKYSDNLAAGTLSSIYKQAGWK
jgi:predicted RNA binding protein YcfA (HicA-like mRNA interferase family)